MCGVADGRVARFTPTGVGTIPRVHRAHVLLAVHPHGRGDNALAVALAVADDGSPPRAWGQSRGEIVELPARRFTPTGVGTILASQAF